MKRAWLWALVLVLGFSLVGCNIDGSPNTSPAPKEPQPSEEDEIAIGRLVTDFGSKLQLVSLLAPQEVAAKTIQEQYGSYLSPTLLSHWQADPTQALGRLTSSPWPDRIEVLTTQSVATDSYEVKAEVVEVTSVEKQSGGAAIKRPVTLAVTKSDGRWLIDKVILGEYKDESTFFYANLQYGFRFALPKSWQGYTIVTTKWEGLPVGGETPIATGPLLSIRHPEWTAEVPRQDIPIMIFTHQQWEDLQAGKFHIGAAPIGPRELNRNEQYVFALPARYNFAFPLGYEEVESILETNPLQPMEMVSGK